MKVNEDEHFKIKLLKIKFSFKLFLTTKTQSHLWLPF